MFFRYEMFCQFGALNSTFDQSSLSIHESFIESEFGNVQKSSNGTQSSRELDQNRAIQLQKDAFTAQVEGRTADALNCYIQLLQTKFVRTDDENHPGYRIRYAALKNISRILPSDKANQAIEYLLEATRLDPSECLLWWRLGSRASYIGNCILARDAYKTAHSINSSHWPSIDALIHINFVLVRDFKLRR